MAFQTLGTIVDDAVLQIAGVSDLEIIVAEGRRFLIIAAEADNAISSFEIMADGSMVFQSEVLMSAGSGTSAVADIELMSLAGGPYIVSAGRWDNNTGVYGFDASTGLSLSFSDTDGSGNYGNMLVSEWVQIGGADYLFSAKQGASGLKVFSVDGTDGSLAYLRDEADTGALPLGDVVDIASAVFFGKTFLFATSAFDAGVQAFEVDISGGLTATGQSNWADGLGYQYPSVLATANVDGSALLLMGSTGSNTITVFRVGSDGSLAPTDQVFDTLNTRFGGIATLEVVVVGGVTYVLAGGGDDGLTLFYLSKIGTLYEIDTVADDFSTTLENVSDVEVFVEGTALHILVGSSSENGVTHLTTDLPYATATVLINERPVFPPEPPMVAVDPGYTEEFRLPEPGGDEFLF